MKNISQLRKKCLKQLKKSFTSEKEPNRILTLLLIIKYKIKSLYRNNKFQKK